MKFLPQIPSFLPVIIASQLTNYRSVVFVFASSDTTGEVGLVCAGLDASLLLVLLAKYIIPILVQQKTPGERRKGEKKVLSRKLHKTEDISFASVSICNLVQQAEYSILHRKNRMFPFMKSCEGGETFCHRKVGGDDLFRGVQMI